MVITGIIAEYNPFHNGHQYQLEQVRLMGATHIAVAMSGNYVQRGDLSVYSKWTRARAALLCGADLVVELPTPCAMSPARDFAHAGVFLLHALGVDRICFGSETGEIAPLKQTATWIEQAEQSDGIKQALQQGMSYPQARETVVRARYGEQAARMLREPNNLLGMEYLRAVERIAPSMEVQMIRRTGVSHDAAQPGGQAASASYLRGLLLEGRQEQVERYVPAPAFQVYLNSPEYRTPVSAASLEQALLYRLRMMEISELKRIRDVTEGFENRLYRAAREAHSLAEILQELSTKRYTQSRMRRILLNCLLGINRDSFGKTPQYARILGCNARGIEILRQAKDHAPLPISPKFATLHKAGFSQAAFENKATDLYSLASQFPCKREFTENSIIFSSQESRND